MPARVVVGEKHGGCVLPVTIARVVYLQSLHILITAYNQWRQERVTLCFPLLSPALARLGAGSRLGRNGPGPTISHPSVSNWKHFLGKQKQGPGEYGPDGRID